MCSSFLLGIYPKMICCALKSKIGSNQKLSNNKMTPVRDIKTAPVNDGLL